MKDTTVKEMARIEVPSSELTIKEPLAWPQQIGAEGGAADRSHFCPQCGVHVRGKFCGRCGAPTRVIGRATPLQLTGPLIQVDGVRKEFGEVVAVDGISFTVGEGEVFGLLGDKGAGKSTVLRLLSGRLTPSHGSVRILGQDPEAPSRHAGAAVGLVLDEGMLYGHLSGRATLVAFARLSGVTPTRVRDVLDLVDLEKAADCPVEQYSAGMRRRLMLAHALLTRPRGLCVDEPTRGLDSKSALEVCALLGRLNKQGMALVLTMRGIDEVGRLCHEVALLHGGRIAALDRSRQLGLRSA